MARPRKIVEPEKSPEKQIVADTESAAIQPLSHTEENIPDSEFENRIVTLLKGYLEKNVYTEKTKLMYEDIISFYGNFDSRMKEVVDKLNNEIEYNKLLDTQLSKKTVEMECIMLKKSLTEERAMLGLKFDEMQKILKEKLAEYDMKEKQMQKTIQDLNDTIDDKLKDFKAIDAKIVENLEKYRADMTSASNNEYNILQNKCVKAIEENKIKFESIKNSIISFLQNCEKQNEALIIKIPEQKRKKDWRDYVIYVLSGLCVISMFVIIFQVIFR